MAMRKIGVGTAGCVCLTLSCLLLLASCQSSSMSGARGPDRLAQARVTQSFDAGWEFSKGDPANAQALTFDDSGWRTLDVPHDWAIEGPIDQNSPSGKSEAFLTEGVGWYRKHFVLAPEYSNREFFIDFDGVMANSDVWINGFHLGKRPYGYVSFRYDLSGHLNFGDKENVLAVRCDESVQPMSRWYNGAGIYRHVRLVTEAPVHLDQYEPFITTPKITKALATVHVSSVVVNQSSSARRVHVMTVIFAPDGEAVAADPSISEDVAPGGQVPFQQDIYVRNPQLWDLNQPNLYRAATQVWSGNELLDNTVSTFGIRDAHFEAASGFWLNGKNIKIYGMAVHCDGGAFGSAVPLGVWERRLAMLKTLGCNAIRTAHNPPSPEFLDLCDRMGLMVMDEAFDVWTVGKTPLTSRTVLADYHLYFRNWWQKDVTDTVERDRNHPSVILWSAGNEIHDITANSDLGTRIFIPLRNLYHKLDPTRPVTLAVVRPNASNVYSNGFADLMDVVGQNYRENELLAAHAREPERKIIGTENHHDVETWLALRDHPEMSGQFLWTGVDYMGESPRWPIISSSAGLLDRTGLAKVTAYQRASWWTKVPIVRIARLTAPPALPPGPPPPPGTDTGPRPMPVRVSDWTSRDAPGHMESLEIYTNCDSVELMLNGKSLGRKNRNANDSPLLWKVAYEPGELKAIARNGGEIVATEALHTAGRPARILLSDDQPVLPAAWDEISVVRVSVVDNKGVTVPDATNLVKFQISGPGFVAAVDNGDPMSHESFRGMERHVFRGHCAAFVKASGAGKITIRATAQDLAGASVEIEGK